MADLGRELRSYLSENDVGEGNNRFSQVFQKSSLSRWFANTDYQRVSTSENGDDWFGQTNDPCLPSFTKRQRILGFIMCVLMGSLCFTLASLYIPFLILKGRKFAMLYTLGSLFLILSFSMLWGPVNHVRHLCTVRSLPFTVLYFGSMSATLYFSIAAHNTGLTVLFAAIQIAAIIWYVVSFIPGGQTGLKFFAKIFSAAVTRTVSKTLPV